MSQYLDSLKIGDTVDIRGPDGKVNYLGKGQILTHQAPSDCSVWYVASAPLLQLYRELQGEAAQQARRDPQLHSRRPNCRRHR